MCTQHVPKWSRASPNDVLNLPAHARTCMCGMIIKLHDGTRHTRSTQIHSYMHWRSPTNPPIHPPTRTYAYCFTHKDHYNFELVKDVLCNLQVRLRHVPKSLFVRVCVGARRVCAWVSTRVYMRVSRSASLSSSYQPTRPNKTLPSANRGAVVG